MNPKHLNSERLFIVSIIIFTNNGAKKKINTVFLFIGVSIMFFK